MKTVHKFELGILDLCEIDMPAGAAVVKVGMQRGKLCLWALVDTGEVYVSRVFASFGTGHAILETRGRSMKYVGTAQDGGEFVWHVFEEVEVTP